MIRIRKAEVLDGFKVRLHLTNGSTVERDIEPLLRGTAFAPLRRSRTAFRAMTVEAGTLTWSNGADLCPDMLIWGGTPPAEPQAQPPKTLQFDL